mgnify:FL=1
MKIEELFVGWYDYDVDEYSSIINNSKISLDTNVLLNIYRYSKETSDKTLYLLNKIKDRLIFSYYVAFEFTKNRKKVESASVEEYKKYQSKIESKYEEIINELKNISNNKLAKKDKLIESIIKNKEKVLQNFDISIDKKMEVFKSGLEEEICQLFEGKIIDKYSDIEFESIKAEGIRRQKNQIPPGYKDEEKGENGDYYIFKQLIDYSKNNDIDIIFVTDDVKEDMFQTIRGIKSPRPELLNEFNKETNHKLIIMTVQEFLNNKIIFDENISEKVLDEIKIISNENRYISIKMQMRIRKFLYRAFKYETEDEIEENSNDISKALRTIIRITEGSNDEQSFNDYENLYLLISENNYSQFINDSVKYRNKIMNIKSKEKEIINNYNKIININSSKEEFINYIDVLINYINIFMDVNYKDDLLKLRDIKRSIFNDFISNERVIKEFDNIYLKLEGDEVMC